MVVEEDMDPRYSSHMLLEEEDDIFDISIDVYGRPFWEVILTTMRQQIAQIWEILRKL